MTRRDPWTWVGLAVVGVTALVWSFTALSDLARRCGVTAVIDLWGWQQVHVAWGLPITVDVLALVATRVWLRGDAPDEAVTYARRAAWAAIVATVVGNGYHGLIVGSFAVDALIVSAAPAVVIGVIVHLAVLVGRHAPADEHEQDDPQPKWTEMHQYGPFPLFHEPDTQHEDERGTATAPAHRTPDETTAAASPVNSVATPARAWPAVEVGDLVDVAAEWGAAEIRAGRTAGKKRLQSQFPGLTEHYAIKASGIAKDRATPVDA